ncbi:MAG TPA: 3'(2'),5'-bisphosphate nucleotidase [Herpetosiphonaceae bacterium]
MPTEREVGLNAVRSAARVCEAVRAVMVNGAEADKLDKQDRSPVTVADFGAQAVVCRLIDESFPSDTIVAEEDSALLRDAAHAQVLAAVERFVRAEVGAADEAAIVRWIDRGNGEPGGRFWVLDPIDGTKGFLRQDQYAIALALIEHGQVTWGFLACPALSRADGTGAIFVAQRSAGAECYTLEGVSLGRVRVSDVASPEQARLAESVESGHTNRGLSAQLQAALGIRAQPVRMDSQAKYAAVAAGQAEIYLRSPNPRTPEYRECIWDHAAGWLIVEEAGGRVTDVYGQPLDWTRGRRLERNIGVIATNGQLHETILGALAPMLP